ncbi:LytR C-terminal domain-containing protein [Cellulomonas edaphi]|uniref:LytR C-terminal domain-containing protein n=1 Tax=Cellulomonas edaphi TaxID=3053468 RepID=A0ABT7S4F1_9CELL|nr:LytR C-terminal domain-containing protein [Cellulomons edaphi]MDM7830501.1 LytR C-terminal domain-containing protein [Cellulomons edaphi]
MSKADYPYADDEFDAPAGPDVPRGVHRAPRSAWSRWWPFVVVIVLVPALAYALVTWASRDNSTNDDASGEPSSSASAPATSGSPGTSETPKSQEPSTETTSEPPASEEPTATAELGTPVVVYNAAGISGLAKSTAGELEAAGFTSVTSTNFSGTKPAASTIYYASEDLEPTAALVGQTLGIDALELSASDAGDGVSVVLVSDPNG